jgi:hypothetical protein
MSWTCRRYEGILTGSFKEEGVDWIHLAQGRGQC